MSKEGIFVQELERNEGLPKPRYGSRRVHYAVKTIYREKEEKEYWGCSTIIKVTKEVYAKCKNEKARLFSYDEYQVTCMTCLQWKREIFMKFDAERKQELERKKRTKRFAKQDGLKRKKGESFKDFAKRYSDELHRKHEENEKKQLQHEVMILSWKDVVTLPLDAKDLKFPLKVIRYEDFEYDSEWGERPSLEELRNSKYRGIEIPFKKYKNLIKDIIKLARNQLKRLKKRNREL